MASTSPQLNVPIVLTIIVLLLSLFQSGLAQERNPARGFKAGNSYSISEIENVNLTNGNLILNIPLASLPGGRGTSPGYTVTLRYNSKLWNSRQERGFDNIPDDTGNGYYFRELLERSDQGGWHLDAGEYRLNVINRQTLEEEAHCTVGNGPEYIRNGYRYKLEMQMPDGSVKEFRPYGTGVPFNDLYGDAWYSIDPGGVRHVYSHMDWNGGGTTCGYQQQQITAAGMHYYTNDGSGIRLFIPYGEYHGIGYFTGYWKMYMPDGSLVENKPPDDPTARQRVTDRNGNKLVWKIGPDGLRIENEVGHCINVAPGAIVQQGVGGEILRTEIEWEARWVHREYPKTHAPNSDPGNRIGHVREGMSVITRIKLPSQAGGLEYQFSYNGDEDTPDWGDYTEGWGELKSVRLPSGARAEYSFTKDGTGPVIDAFEVVSNSVTKRKLTYLLEYNGASVPQTDTTVYSINGDGIGVVTTPDGAVQTEVGPWTGSLKGYAYRILIAGGATVEKIWTTNDAPRVAGGGAATNPYVKTEFSTVADASGNPALTAIKDYDYDKNGNVLEVREYDWVPYSSVPRNGSGIYAGPSGLPSSGLILKRRTVNAYYNPTPVATDFTTDSPNHYANPSSPRLHNVIKSTEVQDGNSVVVSRSEFYYDDPSNKGNLTETRSWDSTKGGLIAPDAIGSKLNSSNSISTRTEYDVYGNVIKTTDARGVESTVLYGDVAGPNGSVGGLYPTQTVAASNYPSVKRTAAADYDFFTGLVLNATDVDNNVSTSNEYDALGRPVKIRRAAGTPLESWTRTEYDDINRLVVTRSDIEVLGDGRKVATTFLDQLGRVRLTKTLEDSSTQSATNETDGIKVETRYGYDDPTPGDSSDPENSRGAFTAVSNPFRAARASDATNEETIGWSRSYSRKDGRYQESETFSGAGLPAPWGSNSNTTGVIKTETDASVTTVTDQAGKKRRSLVDAFNQLVRVDEPNSDGNLGIPSAPVQPTFYFYNANGKLTHVRQAVQDRYFQYDSLGRLLRIRQPEQDVNPALNTTANPDNNAWTGGFVYDNNANLLTSIDARDVRISSTYDALNRQLTRTYSDSTPPVSFTYDAPTVAYSKGKLTKISSSISESRLIEFDAAGRVTASEQVTDGRAYSSAYKYDLSGNLSEQTYPSGRTAKNFLEVDGDVASITSKVANGRFKNYAANFSYTASGEIKRLQLGNGLWESARLNGRKQITELSLGSSATDGSLWRLSYQHGELDASGNIDERKNTGNVARQSISGAGLASSFVQSYKYDPLHRIIDARETNGVNQTWTQSFGYDRYGNRTSLSQNVGGQQLEINNLTLPEIDPITNRFREGQGYRYDAAGNLIENAEGRGFIFNGDNKQVEVRDAQHALVGTYQYDGEGKRIKKIVGNETTTFVYDALGKLVAEMSSTAPSQEATVNYTATDPLGSPRVITNTRGQIVSRRDFMPFGEQLPADPIYRTTNLRYGAVDSVRQKFTGYQRDDETGLDFAEARYYNNRHGRFTAVDPLTASGKSADPQTFNRYVYSMNSPLMFNDPAGLCPDDGKPTTEPCEITPTVAPQSRTVMGQIVDGSNRTVIPNVEATLPEALIQELTRVGELVEQTQVAFDLDRRAALTYAAASLNQIDNLEWGSEMQAVGTSLVSVPFAFPSAGDCVISAFSEANPNMLGQMYVDGQGMLNLPSAMNSGGGASFSALGVGVGVSFPGASYGLSSIAGELEQSSNKLRNRLHEIATSTASRAFAMGHAAVEIQYRVVNSDGTRSSEVRTAALTKYELYQLHHARITAGMAAAQRRQGR